MRFLKITALFLGAALFVAGAWQIRTLNGKIAFLEESLQRAKKAPESTYEAVIYLMEATPTDFFLRPARRQLWGPVNPAMALQALLNGPLSSEGLSAPIPRSTKLLNFLIDEGTAVADFSREIITDFNGGSLLEAYLVQAIVNTLTEFPEIKRVEIRVEGERVESIAGHILILDPLTRYQ